MAEEDVTHHDGQPIIVEVGVLKLFPQPLDTTGEKEERQDTCVGKGPTVRTALLQTPLSARIPGGPPTLQTPMVALTDTSDHQQLPKEEQHVCDFIQDNHPVVGGKQPGVRSWRGWEQ